VTYDLAIRPGPPEGGYLTLEVVGGTGSSAQVPFEPQPSYVSNVSDTQLIDCNSGDCQLSVQPSGGVGIVELQYADITITQVNAGS
jgi:hypothetical protein